ncbi:MAG TPA: hypothetical protein VMJ10_18765 [Kofleriaceae bacterium]|nr:hypothetical protein [Kofleriaceae bacterium]
MEAFPTCRSSIVDASNVFVVAEITTEDEARTIAAEFEARGHKQMCSVECVERRRSTTRSTSRPSSTSSSTRTTISCTAWFQFAPSNARTRQCDSRAAIRMFD